MRSGVCEMHLEPVYISGVWWLDLTQAAEMLSLSPASLKRHYIAYDLDSIVWHHVLLFRLDDVSRLSADRLREPAVIRQRQKSEIFAPLASGS